MNRYTFRWNGTTVEVLTLPSLNVQRTFQRAKAAYMDNGQVVVIDSCNTILRF